MAIKISKLRNIPIFERLLRLIPDSLYLRILYKKNVGRWPDLKNPQTFTEKIQWLKLHNRKPEYSVMVDKYLVKDYVAKIIGEEYIIPTLAVWNKVEDIDITGLPNQFVLKWNHDSGSIVICRDKSTFDLESTKRKLANGARKNGFWYGREWPYKGVKPCIIAEKYLDPRPATNDLPDYKWYCFDGEPKFCQVIKDRNSNETIDFFDTEWNHQQFVGLNPVNGPAVGPALVVPSRPQNLSEQIEIAKKLSKDIPFSRIDLYEINDKEYFGEVTLYPASGFGVFSPKEWDTILGSMLQLPGVGGANS